MERTKGNTRFSISMDDARACSRDLASVQAEREKKPGEARPFFPSGLLPLAQPPRALLSKKWVNEAATQALVRSHLPCKGI